MTTEIFECNFPSPEKPSKKYTEIELLPLPDKISVPIVKDLEYMQKTAKVLEEIRHVWIDPDTRKSSYDKKQAEQYLLVNGWEVIRVVKPVNKEQIYVTLQDMIKYCNETVGLGGLYESLTDNNWSWCYFSWFGYWVFYFENKDDAEKFYSEGMPNSHKKVIV